MTRVEATFKANRSIVAKRRTEGKEENSNGLRVPMAIMMIKTLEAMLNVNKTSRKNGGRGKTNMPMINNTRAGILRSAKLNFDRFCRMVDRLSVDMNCRFEMLLTCNWSQVD